MSMSAKTTDSSFSEVTALNRKHCVWRREYVTLARPGWHIQRWQFWCVLQVCMSIFGFVVLLIGSRDNDEKEPFWLEPTQLAVQLMRLGENNYVTNIVRPAMLLSGPLVGIYETSNSVLSIRIICMSCKHSMQRLLTFPLYLFAGNSKNNTLADKAHLFIGSMRIPKFYYVLKS